MENTVTITAEETKNILERYFSSKIGDLVFRVFVLEKQNFQLEQEVERLKEQLHKTQLDLLKAQGKEIIDGK
jgi:hypothetical protein